MATCLEVITNAMRLSRVLGVGKEPKGPESELGMDCLQGLYDTWLSSGMFGRLRDVYLTADTLAQEGRRYYVPAGITLTDATNDYVPKADVRDDGTNYPYDYGFSTCADGTTRQPRDLACYEALTSTGGRTAKLYDRTQWVDLLDLDLSDDAPLSSRGATGLAAALATYGALAAAFGAEPGQRVGVLASAFLSGLSYKIGSTRDTAPAEYF